MIASFICSEVKLLALSPTPYYIKLKRQVKNPTTLFKRSRRCSPGVMVCPTYIFLHLTFQTWVDQVQTRGTLAT